MENYTALFESDNLHLYSKEFGNNNINTFDCMRIEQGTSGKVYLSSFHVSMDEYKDKSLLDVLKYYHVTRFYGLNIDEYPNMQTALNSVRSIVS